MADHAAPLYVVLHNDRHTDPDVKVFTQYDNALVYARTTAQRCATHPAYITEQVFGPDDPADERHWFFVEYSTEGDGLAIMTRRIQDAREAQA